MQVSSTSLKRTRSGVLRGDWITSRSILNDLGAYKELDLGFLPKNKVDLGLFEIVVLDMP
jgi:hypothetical protein